MESTFLTLGEVLEIHRDQLERYGGDSGIRDLGLLQSAIAQPAVTYRGRFLHESIHEMAATYLYHLVKDHCFVDGNKQVGTVTSIVFLLLNGLRFTAPEDALTELVMGIARGEIEKAEVVLFYRDWVVEPG